MVSVLTAPSAATFAAAVRGSLRTRLSTVDIRRLVLGGAALAAFTFAPIEGYLIALHPQMGKLSGVVLFGAWALLRWRLPQRPRIHGVYVLLATLAAIVLISATLHLADPYTVEYTVRWIPFIAITAVITDVASAVIGVRLLMAAALVGATVAAIGALFSFLVLHEPRATGPLDDPNDLANVLAAALPLVIAFAPRRLVARVCVVGAAVAIIVAIAATLSRGAILACAAALIWVLARRVVRGRLVLSVAAGALMAAVLAVSTAGPLIAQALSEKMSIAGDNIDSRLMRWEAAARMLAGHPFVGVGPGGFRGEYVAMSKLAEVAEQTPVAHNMYLEVGAELGVLGLLVFVGLIVAAFMSSEHALRRGADRRVVVAIQASLIAVVVASFFLSEQYYFPLWSMIALACAIGIRVGPGAPT